MVTHSARRSGSMTIAQTFSGGAAITMLAFTSGTRRNLSGLERFDRLPLGQRVLDSTVEAVHADAEQLGGLAAAGKESGAQAAHQGGDEADVLGGDRRGHGS